MKQEEAPFSFTDPMQQVQQPDSYGKSKVLKNQNDSNVGSSTKWFHLSEDLEKKKHFIPEFNSQDYHPESSFLNPQGSCIQNWIKNLNKESGEKIQEKKYEQVQKKINLMEDNLQIPGGRQSEESISSEESSSNGYLPPNLQRKRSIVSGLQRSIANTILIIMKKYVQKHHTSLQYEFPKGINKKAFDSLFEAQQLRPAFQEMFKRRYLQREILLTKIKEKDKTKRYILKISIVRTLEKAFKERKKLPRLFKYHSFSE